VSEWIEEPFELELPLGATVEDLLVEVQRLWPSNEVTWLADRDGHAISLNTPIQEVSEVMQGTTPNAEDDREEREEREEERLVSQEEGLEVLVSRPLTRDQQEALQGFLAGTRVPANHQRYLRGKNLAEKMPKSIPGSAEEVEAMTIKCLAAWGEASLILRDDVDPESDSLYRYHVQVKLLGRKAVGLVSFSNYLGLVSIFLKNIFKKKKKKKKKNE